MNQYNRPRKPRVDFGAKAQLYRGCDVENELSFNGCVFHAAHFIELVEIGETGFGWNNAQICDLTDRIRVSIESDPTVLDGLPKAIGVKLFEGLNLIAASDRTTAD